jgi:hypothetical protein
MSSTENRAEWSEGVLKIPTNWKDLLDKPTKIEVEKANVLRVTWHAPETYFKIPTDWELKDIEVRWGKLYYKTVLYELEEAESEGDCKRPVEMDILTDDAAEDYFGLFD